MFGDHDSLRSIPLEPLEVHRRIISFDRRPIDMDPTSNKALVSQEVINVDKLTNALELVRVPRVTCHIEIDGK